MHLDDNKIKNLSLKRGVTDFNSILNQSIRNSAQSFNGDFFKNQIKDKNSTT